MSEKAFELGSRGIRIKTERDDRRISLPTWRTIEACGSTNRTKFMLFLCQRHLTLNTLGVMSQFSIWTDFREGYCVIIPITVKGEAQIEEITIPVCSNFVSSWLIAAHSLL